MSKDLEWQQSTLKTTLPTLLMVELQTMKDRTNQEPSDPTNIQSAWQKVRRNRVAQGMDGMTIGEFSDQSYGFR